MFDTTPYEQRIEQAIAHFNEELKKVRTGRAHPDMLQSVMVDAYGTKTPLSHVANVVATEPQLLQITPFDPSNLPAIVAAIRDDQSLGFNPSDDGRIVRVPVPTLTTERRQQMVKSLGDKVEDARIAMRNIRHDALKDAKQAEKDKAISKDDYTRIEKTMDDAMTKGNACLDESAKAKEADIMTI